MKLQIDNLDGTGVRDYSVALDASKLPRIVRKLNQPTEMRAGLVSSSADFVVPAKGAHVTLTKNNGQSVFTGYLRAAPEFEYLGWGERGPVYRYSLVGQSDETILQRKRLPYRPPFVARSAGDALQQITQDLQPGAFDTSGVQNVDVLAKYDPDPQRAWAEHAADIALQARGCYRTLGGALIFTPVGAANYTLNETDSGFQPEGLKVQSTDALVNDVTVIGEIEPQAYVRDYFVGDGLTLKYYLSQTPFASRSHTLFNEEYPGPELDAAKWTVSDPASAVSVSDGNLQVAGGTGTDGGTTVQFAEKIELGGATVLQHGDVVFNAASSGVLGGLYAGAITAAGCLAGFQITPNGTQSNIQALLNGAVTGPVMTTVAGHHYVLTTRLYSQVIFRKEQTFHSGAHPAGSGIGGGLIDADVRIVLEVHEIDPATPATQVASSTVLYDGVIADAPAYCSYVLVNAVNMESSIAFTRMISVPDTEVRSALPGDTYDTLLVGALSDGAQCNITAGPALDFFTSYVPAPNQLIEVHYRGEGRALTRVTNPASISAQAHGGDDGIRSRVWRMKEPSARTAKDCENAALAILEGAATGWAGEYETWSDFLPAGATDIFPGDGLQVNAPSRGTSCAAIVRAVEIEFWNLAQERSRYKIAFADEVATPLGFQLEKQNAGSLGTLLDRLAVSSTQLGDLFLTDLTAAAITAASSTTITVDAGATPPSGGGFEVRWSDLGWGQGNSRNLVGRFGTQAFTVPRLSRVQTIFLRQYDASAPPRYSRYSAALHLDYPL